VLDEVATDGFRARSEELGRVLRSRLDTLAERVPQVGEVRGLGPMLALELVEDRDSKRPAGDLAKATVARALDGGLILLTCGLYGNVVRILVPLVASDEDVNRGLEIMEEALVGAAG
jgi:4-aminobutyrate aminotransferase-like enzyme